MDKTYKSDILAVIHEAASDLREAGVLNKSEMRRFDELCLSAGEKRSGKKNQSANLEENITVKKANHD